MKWLFKETVPNKLEAVVDKYALWTVLVTIIITIVLASLIFNLKFENAPDKFGLPDDDPVKIERDMFESQFSPGELILVGVRFEKNINADELLLIRDLSRQSSEIKGIESVKSIIDATEYEWAKKFGINVMISRPFISFKKIDVTFIIFESTLLDLR